MLGRDRPGTRGQSVVELALLLPFLLWVAAGVVDFGRVYYYDIVMINAARAGARAAADVRNSDSVIRQAVKDDAAPVAISDANITITPAGTRSTGDTAAVSAAHSFTPITPLVGSLFPGGNITISRSAAMVAF